MNVLELIRQLSDDQMAVLGCLGALGVAMLLLSISFHSNLPNRNASPADGMAADPAGSSSGGEQRRRAA